ncbi:MAG: ester cyclase [Alphaproteobacteria bacterium]
MSFQAEKALVRAYYDALAAATPDSVDAVLGKYIADHWLWRGMHPFHEQIGAPAVANAFWKPFLNAFHTVRRRQDVFMAGENEIDGFQSVWVVSMGHLMVLFDRPFLNIPPTRKLTMIRYAEFNKIEHGKITETAFFCDLLHLMRQAGLNPLPLQTGQHLIQPGPATHDGLLFDDADRNAGNATLALINRMINDINDHGALTPQQELSRTWHDDMIWWGPEGIGATYGIDRYIEQHQKPFRTQIADRKFNGHICRLAEGDFGGFFGWPNLTVTPIGDYMGLPATHQPADMRVVDIYRRDGDKLAENWIFIDMLHFLNQQGIDILKKIVP